MTKPRPPAVTAEQQAYNELCYYTLAHGDPSFIHQHVVDAFAAQSADERDKPIKLTFALVGLYLHVEKQLSGKQVQRVHMQLGRQKRRWPMLTLPTDRGAINATSVMAAPAGTDRDKMIHQWCASVWEAFRESRQVVVDLLGQYEIA